METDATNLPIGSRIVENEGDIPGMTHLCRFGYFPMQHLPGGRVLMERHFPKLYTLQELVGQSQQ
ncbi:MAG TPA: hypothetical protein VMB81_21850 [Candidatus Sulfotelmatobacter sp.]|nr:hypothetical protein [Candidatus Sulfotelmatobacter sp.]